MRIYRLKIELPFLHKGNTYCFDDDTGYVYMREHLAIISEEYPLRSGLSGYLWLLLTEGNKYFKRLLEVQNEKK